MKNLVLLLIILFSTSCLTVKRIERNCDTFAKVCITDKETTIVTETVYKDTIIYRDTVIYKTLLGKIVERKIPVIIRGRFVNSELSVLEVPFAISYAEIKNSLLEHRLVQSDTTIRIELEGALKDARHWKSEYIKETNKETITIKENTAFATFTIKVFWGLLIVAILAIGFLILKFKSKLLGIVKKFV